ncbi:putative acetyltransferase [Orenia metallireducens]|uniref:Putative acetyltransferase n=1 Tax=Orenia metallireducens TaxID=1413210 RepID=A0A285F3G7_9FIRM|nr:N-acetyltransferase [Orenia metallireducens]PRX34706.1 putative acetyltransferase [Orenia metallireducens]SNY05264.1 putative acetyltransferase [Orenia metallireducens]
MIRNSNKDDLDKIVHLWYEVSLKAHDFIDKEYWKTSQQDMKEKYIPLSDTYIIEEDNQLRGFISMVDNYLAALFVASNFQSSGYGKRLLDHVKKNRDYIELKVFKKNKKAYNFYSNNEFIIEQELLSEDLKEKEYLMVWRAEK